MNSIIFSNNIRYSRHPKTRQGPKGICDAIVFDLSNKLGIKSLVHISAIGANENSNSIYSSTKAKGENAILSNFPSAVILRPSIVFGQEDQFFNRFAKMATMAPVLPLVGANTRLQPVFVDDVAKAAEAALLGSVPKGIYELGGPEIKDFRELMIVMLKIMQMFRCYM